MMQDIGSKTLKVLPDVFFVRSDDGVWLRNSIGSFYVKGAQAYDLVRTLLSQLDGTRTLDEVCKEFTPERRPALYQRLLYPLMSNGFLLEVQAVAEAVPAWVSERYQEHIAFLERYVDQPVKRLLEVRSRQIICLGSGLILRAITVALADLGFARVRVLAADNETDLALLGNIVAQAGRLDEDSEWILKSLPPAISLQDMLHESAGTSADAILLGVAAMAPAEIADALEILGENGPAVGIVAPAGGLLLASPLLPDKNWCWECLYRSVVSDSPADPAPPSAALAGFQVVQRLFCRLAGDPVPEDRQLTTVDCHSLNVQVHTPRQHPSCTRHEDGGIQSEIGISLLEQDDTLVRPDVPTSRDSEESMALQNTIIKTIASWTDRQTGPFLVVDEEDLEQLPLSASRCKMRGPNSRPWASDVQTFECRALAPREARNQSVLWALEWLAAEIKGQKGGLQGSVVGAGWSTAEAIYRAWATLSSRNLAGRGATIGNEVDLRRLPQSPARNFLWDSLKNRGYGDVEIRLDESPNRLLIAQVRNNEGESIGCGVGINPEHAVDHALADVLARISSTRSNGFRFTAYPSPPATRWTEVLRWMAAKMANRYTVVDVTHWLRFLAGQAHIVVIAPAAAQPAGALE
jgi:hypothetical protein